MKKLFLLLGVLFVFTFAVNAQKTQYFTNDTVQGAETIYFTYSKSVPEYLSVVAFQFTKTDIKDSCSVIQIEGSLDNSSILLRF